jgi:ribosomal protein S18 acetylase RimI-like enzyme
MPTIRAFQPEDLSQLTQIINTHISMLIPTWELPSELILSRLEKNPDEPVIDPWVIERATFCAFVGENLVAAAHLLRYGDTETVNENHHNHGDIAWFVFEPAFESEAKELLSACHAQMRDWQVKTLGAWESGLYVPCFTGISDNWPHIGKLFYEAGYRPNPERAEAVFGGGFDGVYSPRELPDKFAMKHRITANEIAIGLHRYGERVATIEARIDCSENDTKPALKTWAELSEVEVAETWRRRGVGTMLIDYLVFLLKDAGASQVVFSVAKDDEEAGAGAFYRSLGFKPFSRSQDAWEYDGKL